MGAHVRRRSLRKTVVTQQHPKSYYSSDLNSEALTRSRLLRGPCTDVTLLISSNSMPSQLPSI